MYDQVTQREERNYAWDDEVSNAIEPVTESAAQVSADLRGGSHCSRHCRELGGRDRHAEEADRQNIYRLRVGE